MRAGDIVLVSLGTINSRPSSRLFRAAIRETAAYRLPLNPESSLTPKEAVHAEREA